MFRLSLSRYNKKNSVLNGFNSQNNKSKWFYAFYLGPSQIDYPHQFTPYEANFIFSKNLSHGSIMCHGTCIGHRHLGPSQIDSPHRFNPYEANFIFSKISSCAMVPSCAREGHCTQAAAVRTLCVPPHVCPCSPLSSSSNML